MGKKDAAPVPKKESWRADVVAATEQPRVSEHSDLDDEGRGLFQKAQESGGYGFNTLFLLCFTAAIIPCVASSLLWSDMGYGKDVYDALEETQFAGMIMLSCAAGCIQVLYLLDFFWPPHLPRHFCVLYDGATGMGRLIVVGVMLLGFVGGILIGAALPLAPPVLTAVLGPAFMGSVRAVTKRADMEKRDLSRGMAVGRMQINKLTEKQRLEYLKSFLLGSAKDARTFFASAMSAFFVSALLSGMIWLAWALKMGRAGASVSASEDKEAYLRWCVPAIVALFNLALASLCAMRVRLSDSYGETIKADCSSEGKDESKQEGKDESKQEGKQEGRDQESTSGAEGTAKEHRDNLMKRLANYMKLVNTVAFVLLGSTKAASELAALESSAANLLLLFIGLTLCIFYLFTFITFKRLAGAIREWAMELPLWRMMYKLSKNDWVRAGMLCLVFPMTPCLLLLSLVNQYVRVSRGLYSHARPARKRFDKRFMPDETPIKAETTIVVEPVQDDQFFTARFMNFFRLIDEWDWVSIYEKMTILGFLVSCSTLSTKFLNIFLSWLVSILVALPLATLLACAFVSGLICFLLPPVPGVPIYLFTGLLVATKHEEIGFWAACVVAVILAFGLKLMACAMQQQIIGRSLGNRNSVRSLVGVQKPLIRAIETVLSRKGLSVAKVAIACGGPDWPTSVLAGLLRLSLFEMEMATLPVVFFVAPCVLSGAFYIRREDGPIWEASGNLMLQVTVVAAVLMQLVAAWAIQDVLDNQTFSVTKPLEKNLDLDWLDYQRCEISQAAKLRFQDISIVNRVLLVLGMVVEVLVGELLYFQGSRCFGTFAVTDPISSLELWGTEDAFLKPLGLVCLILIAVGMGLLGAHVLLINQTRRKSTASRALDLAAQKAKWMTYRRLLAHEVDMFVPAREAPFPSPLVPQE